MERARDAMSRAVIAGNRDAYAGAAARALWTADRGFYPGEAEIVRRHLPRAPARVLDVGCGAGRTTVALEALGYELDAIDLSHDLVDEARARVTRARVQQMSACTLAFADASFDAVLFSFNGLDCIYPNADRQRALAEIQRVLRPGGVFAYSGHNGIAAWRPRRGDDWRAALARDRRLARAQWTPFVDRVHYLAYPEDGGTQVLYSAPPPLHLRDLRRAGLEPLVVYGSHSYRKDPDLIEAPDPARWTLGLAAALSRITLSCPHVHYVARKLAG